MDNKNIIQVALVDDHTLFRDGLTNLLGEYSDIRVVFSAKSGEDLKAKLQGRSLPEVILMDINMPSMDGHEATIWLKRNYPLIHVLALSMYEDDFTIIKMIRGGAGGYILKESNTDEVVRGIRTVAAQGYFVNEIISGRLIHSIREEVNDVKSKITERELEFMRLCCSELTYKEIAYIMRISPRTVDNYREDLFQKLKIRSRTGLVLYAIKNNFVKIYET